MGNFLLLVVAAWLFIGCTTRVADASDISPEVIHVGGKVMCQDCSQGYNEWVHGARGIQGSRVAIVCMDERHRVAFYGSDETDASGAFDLVVNKYVNRKEVNPRSCSVKLISSPDPSCNIATNFAGGISGVKLTRPTMVYREITKYTVGPFYYTSPMCEDPESNED